FWRIDVPPHGPMQPGAGNEIMPANQCIGREEQSRTGFAGSSRRRTGDNRMQLDRGDESYDLRCLSRNGAI
ncbi:hypothetical protein K4H00_27215, partial [Mycobacterium tuberculosis]|nr:hypothetical protein [Mycobacterium tuberculosis]